MNASEYIAKTAWIDSLELPCSLPIKEGCNVPNYPVVSKEQIQIAFQYAVKNKCQAEVRIAIQDGISVGGINYMVGGGGSEGDGGRAFSPGRKWGEFPSSTAADLYYSRYLLKCLIQKSEYSSKHKKLIEPCLKELIKHIDSINFQLELFA